ncbi:MAG: hypothetical protein IJ265_00475 [Oscillospiraceae bacterium]|nr:hypothetical protein [Oscillospiraceae bacterium]
MNKSNSQVEQDIAAYLKEKYDQEFTVSVTDRPNHLYSSYGATAYDENQNDFEVSITYYDAELFSVSDSYLLYGMQEDFEAWFMELADPYIDSDFKVFLIPISGLPSEYYECETVEEFLDISPTGTYYGVKFLIMLPASEYHKDIRMMVDNITHRMLELKIRGQVTAIVYEEADIYEKTLTRKDESFFFQRHFRHRICSSTLKSDFSITTDDEILEFGIAGYREGLDDYVGGK